MAKTFTLTGDKALARRLRRLAVTNPAAVASGLFQEAERIMGQAKNRAPVDTGTLRDSGIVDKPKISGTSIEVTMGFGGAAGAYAGVQHEIHKSQSKYLERPLMEAVGGFDSRMAAHIRVFLMGARL